MSLSVAFTDATFQRFLVLAVGAVLTRGTRTIANILRTLGHLAPGHFSDYHRVFSRAPWRPCRLGLPLASCILALTDPDETLRIAVDDTTAEHRGTKVYGKGCHRDAVRSSHKHTAYRWGHRWVVLSICVRLPFTSRYWALPALVALYRPKALNKQEGRPHKTESELARQLMAALMRWFPHRQFLLLGDGGYASHRLAKFCARHGRRVGLVSRFYPDAALYEPPPPRKPHQKGRSRIKGQKLPTPEQVVAHSRRRQAVVSWYGGSSRRVELVSGVGHWYKTGQGLVLVRWVFVHDLDGTHRDEYFFTTDAKLSPEEIVSLYTTRWSIETTFQEVRAHLGFETTRQWVKNSVLRAGPCLLGLFSVVCVIFAEHVKTHGVRFRNTPWYHKGHVTFSDALATVRRLFWEQTVFAQPAWRTLYRKTPPELRSFLLDCLARAA